MTSLRDVGDALRRVLDAIDQSIAAHHQAADLAEQARELLTEPEGQVSTLATAADEIRSYLQGHGISNETAGDPTPAAASARQPSPSSAEQVEALREQLPPPVRSGTGQKTHGRWFTPSDDQARPIVSGEDAESAEVWRVLQETRFPEKCPPITIMHVETKLAAVATLEIWYDQKPDNDYGLGDPAIIVTTHDELSAFVDRVSAQSAAQPCPSLIEVSIAEDPYGFPTVNAGIGADRGYVRVSGADELRATQGDQDATGDLVYDFQGHETLVPASYEVPLDTGRAVLAAYLDHGGLIPEGFPRLHEVAAV